MSTLHTKNSLAAITRLLDLGVDPFLVTSSVNLIVAQRLARRLCDHCKEAYTPPRELLRKVRLEDPGLTFYRAPGCSACAKTGYAGRIGVYEMLRMTNALKELIRRKASESELRRAAAAAGTRFLLEDGLSKVRQGLTSLEELLRVIELEVEDTYQCPQCGAVVRREFKTCPYCVSRLRKTCQSCEQELKPEWQICPYCIRPVSGQASLAETQTLLPESSRDQLPSSRKNLSTAGQVAALPDVKRPNILVVDDDKGIIRVIQKTLAQLPMDAEVFTAADGVEALNTIEQRKVDLVILDVKMPRLDGFAVCERLRKDIRTAFLPIMMLTANSEDDNRTKGFLVGTDDFLAKPFAAPDFLARVTRLLRRTYGL